MRREKSDHIVVAMMNDWVVAPVKDEDLRRRVRWRWKWTKSWIGEPHHPSARGLSRRDFLDCRPQLIVRECSGVVHGDLAGAIEQHKGRSRGGAVGVEVVFADGNRHVEQAGVEAAA